MTQAQKPELPGRSKKQEPQSDDKSPPPRERPSRGRSGSRLVVIFVAAVLTLSALLALFALGQFGKAMEAMKANSEPLSISVSPLDNKKSQVDLNEFSQKIQNEIDSTQELLTQIHAQIKRQAAVKEAVDGSKGTVKPDEKSEEQG